MSTFILDWTPADNAMARVRAKCTVAKSSEWPDLSMSTDELLQLQEDVGDFAQQIAMNATDEVLNDLWGFMVSLAIAIDKSREQKENLT